MLIFFLELVIGILMQNFYNIGKFAFLLVFVSNEIPINVVF